MRLKFILAVFVCASLLSGQDKLNYDGSGQMGTISHQGLLNWNSDLFVGSILLDGTLHFFPDRLGPKLSQEITYTIRPDTISYVDHDSTKVTTEIDYQMGDFELDQLELLGRFSSKVSQTRFYGFKRTFSGDGFPAQYIRLDGKNIPIQQSYIMDYNARSKNRSILATVALFNADYNFIGSDFLTYGKIYDKSLAGGIRIEQRYSNFNLATGISQHQQAYQSSLPYLPARSKVRLSRQNVFAQVTDIDFYNSNIYSTISLNSQGVKQQQNSAMIRNWGEFNAGLKTKLLSADIGLLYNWDRIFPTGHVQANFIGKRLKANSNIRIFHKPNHALISSSSNDWESWTTGNVQLIANISGGSIGGEISLFDARSVKVINYDAGQWTPFLLDDQLFSFSLFSEYSILEKINIHLSWLHTDNTSFLADGVGDRIKSVLTFKQRINLIQIDMLGEIGFEGLFNRNTEIAFDPHWGIPVGNGPIANYNQSNFNLFGKIEVTISSMTIYAAAQNIPNLLSNKISSIDTQKTWVQNNPFVPPTGKMVIFGVKWNFNN